MSYVSEFSIPEDKVINPEQLRAYIVALAPDHGNFVCKWMARDGARLLVSTDIPIESAQEAIQQVIDSYEYVPKPDPSPYPIYLSNHDPSVNDDESGGFFIGQVWYNKSDNRTYICVDASVGASVWNLMAGVL